MTEETTTQTTTQEPVYKKWGFWVIAIFTIFIIISISSTSDEVNRVEKEMEVEKLKTQTVEEARENYLKTVGGWSSGGEEYHGCVFDYYMEKVGVPGFVEETTKIDKTGESTPLMDDAAEACIKYADETMYEMKDEHYRWLEIKGYDEPSFENYEEFIDAK
jgi:hypothetical protein